MSYVSLYRKYRPQTFDDVVGQEHVTRTLRNAIDEDRLSHAYLFTGPRGTGKTSTARILAKAINCEQGPTAAPCGTCTHCASITDGSSVDVIELDMASHGGVDDARELRDRALFAPASARRKVYILDEVHMASTAAFNALLKLIEEPPAHVLFAMATTDPQKVLPTIMSRVQRLDLRRVGARALAEHVTQLCADEGYEIEEAAVEAVVRAGDGSVRDTLSVLEQVLAYAGREVSAEAVAQTLGQTPVDRVLGTVEQLGARDLAALLATVQALLDDGHDLRRFTLDLVQHLRDLLVLQVAPDRSDLVDATDERRRRLQAQTAVLPRTTLLRAVDRLATTITEQRQGAPRLPLELALAQLAVPGADGDVAELADRVARLEAGAGAAAPGASTPSASTPSASTSSVVPPASSGSSAPASAPPVEAAAPSAPAPSPVPPAAAADSEDPLAGSRPGSEPAPPAATHRLEGGGSASGAASASNGWDDAGSDGDAFAPAAEEHADVAAAGDAADVPAPGSGEGAADEAGTPAPGAPADDPGAPVGADEPGDAAAGRAEDLEGLRASWDGVLELIKQGSRRHHAMIEPATPVGLSRGIVTLRYGRRHASFHAVQARTGELDQALRDAIEQACGIRVRIDVKVEGEDDRRRPVPPSVTPDDARTPVLDDRAASPPTGASAAAATPAEEASVGADADEGSEVREAEHGGTGAQVDVDALLASELDAQLLEERPPPGAGG